MKKTGLIILFLLAMFLSAQSAYADYCNGGSTLVKVVNFTTGGNTTSYEIPQSCPFGCDSQFQKCNEEFFIPVLFYFFFEAIAVVMVFSSLLVAFGRKDSHPIPFIPLLSLIIFSILAIGTVHYFIMLFNSLLAIVSIFMAIYYLALSVRQTVE
jgi:hypothetical protein